MSDPIIRVTARDLELGDEGVVHLKPGQFVVTCAEPLYVAREDRSRNGTVVVTLKRRDAS
jgi:hypothetical protein